MKKCLIFFDEEDAQNSIDLLEVANQIYCNDQYETYAVCLNQQVQGIHGKFDYLFAINSHCIANYDVENLTNCLEELQKKFGFDSILIPATYFGRMLAPRLAMRLKIGLVADVTAIGHDQGAVEMIRPAFSGKILAGIINQNCKTIMMSVRPNVFAYTMEQIKQTKRIEFEPETIKQSKIKLLHTSNKEVTADIREHSILVSGGGGVMYEFKQLQKLADELNAMVSASRRIVDSGVASRSIQVGQSGKTVSPKLYIALGIYGSLQHIEGLKNIEYMISVNTNKDAPICSLSDIVVEGDAVEFIDKLVNKIRNSEE